MNDRPVAVELLRAVEAFLEREVVPALAGPGQFHARVAANVVAMVAREIETEEAHEAWCPPTFSPSRLGRMWFAWWIIQAESQSSLRSSACRISTRRAASGVSWRRDLPSAVIPGLPRPFGPSRTFGRRHQHREALLGDALLVQVHRDQLPQVFRVAGAQGADDGQVPAATEAGVEDLRPDPAHVGVGQRGRPEVGREDTLADPAGNRVAGDLHEA